MRYYAQGCLLIYEIISWLNSWQTLTPPLLFNSLLVYLSSPLLAFVKVSFLLELHFYASSPKIRVISAWLTDNSHSCISCTRELYVLLKHVRGLLRTEDSQRTCEEFSQRANTSVCVVILALVQAWVHISVRGRIGHQQYTWGGRKNPPRQDSTSLYFIFNSFHAEAIFFKRKLSHK